MTLNLCKINNLSVGFLVSFVLVASCWDWLWFKYFKERIMNWLLLVVAGLFEVAFAFCLGKAKESTGNEMYLWYVGFLLTLSISMGLLVKATQALPIGTAYAVWTGIGAVGTVLVGIFVFKEPTTFLRLLFISTLIMSIIGLKAVSH